MAPNNLLTGNLNAFATFCNIYALKLRKFAAILICSASRNRVQLLVQYKSGITISFVASCWLFLGKATDIYVMITGEMS